MRDTIFISHATPEDNDFIIWLASRLKLLGYNVWIDKNALLGGEKFWEEIDQTIRNRAAKILLVYSGNICVKDDNKRPIPGRLKDGVSKEYSLAESVGKQNKLHDFIILMNIDGSTYNLFIGADRLNQIPFYDNWADGFKQLEKKLIKDGINKSEDLIDKSFSQWYSTQYIVPNGISEKKELYYTNWWPINKLPEYFYIFEFKTEKQAKAIHLSKDNKFPTSKIANHLSSFEPSPSFPVRHENVHRLKISDILLGFESNSFPTQRDAENHFKHLLQRCFHLLLKERGLYWYTMANKKIAYYHTLNSLKEMKVKFEYPYRTINKSKTKNLIGKHTNLGCWHFGISAKPIFSPLLGFSLKSHLVFTDDGVNIWKTKEKEVDKERIHSQRRAKGKRFFNDEWRDLLIAFIQSLTSENGIGLLLSTDFDLKMPEFPEYYWADFGYFDPKDKSRQGLLTLYEAIDSEDSDNDSPEDQEDQDVDSNL